MSMYPPIFETAGASAAVTALIGSSPVRLWPFAQAPENSVLPYVVWQTIGGSPENYINNAPDIDQFSLQVDVYGTGASSVRAVAVALRDAIQGVANIVSWRGESIDFETKNYRFTFDVDWLVRR